MNDKNRQLLVNISLTAKFLISSVVERHPMLKDFEEKMIHTKKYEMVTELFVNEPTGLQNLN